MAYFALGFFAQYNLVRVKLQDDKSHINWQHDYYCDQQQASIELNHYFQPRKNRLFRLNLPIEKSHWALQWGTSGLGRIRRIVDAEVLT